MENSNRVPAWVILASAGMISLSIVAAGIGGVYVYRTAGVAPVVQSDLKSLAAEGSADKWSEAFRAMSVAVKYTSISTKSELREGLRSAAKAVREIYEIPESPELSAEVDRRMQSEFGLDDGPIDKQKFSEFFMGISQALK